METTSGPGPARGSREDIRRGLKLLITAIVLHLVGSLLFVAWRVGLVVVSPVAPETFFTYYLPAWNIPAIVLSLTYAVTLLAGFYLNYRGRWRAGPIHARNVGGALVMLLVSIVAVVVSQGLFIGGALVGPYLGISGFEIVEMTQRLVFVSSILRLAAGITIASLLYLLVVALVPRELIPRLWWGVALFILAAFISFLFFAVPPLSESLAPGTLWTFTSEAVYVFQLSDLAVGLIPVGPDMISVLLFWSVYRAAYGRWIDSTTQS